MRTSPRRSPLDLVPVVLLAAIAAFVAVQLWRAPRSPLAAGMTATPAGRAREAAELHAALAPDAIRQRLRDEGGATYIGALLGADSLLLRWANGPDAPVLVWIEPLSAVPGWNATHRATARRAFAAWEQAVPLRFAFVPDSAAADVQLRWVARLPGERQVGSTDRVYAEGGALVRAVIALAVYDPEGTALSERIVRQVALHEVGHALGLEHSPDAADLMAARYDGRMSGLSAADVATARLLYALPPGGLAGARPR